MRIINPHHLKNALLYSLAGLARAWKNEQAFRHEVLLCPLIALLLLVLRPGAGWTAAAVGGWFLVMAFELLNSAIEEAFNLISPDYNEHVKFGKDMASAAIFMALAANGMLWLCLLWSLFAG